ncbi:MAG: 3-phosphoshikimate 1-carboxyvinyltransferase [Deltaproteobacteria bacterium]|nr:3-phosphoshikimate 1-carboxyvinyltransferase [Deltaproteobacteria bacterium]
MSFLVPKLHKIQGCWQPPADKSISHRALILASLAEGTSHIQNFLKAEDCLATARALKMMGIEMIEDKEGLHVIGNGLWGLKKPSHVLDVANSGTTLRLLTGLLSAQKFSSVITGDRSLVRRPTGELLKLLRSMGAHLQAHEDTYAPIHIYPPRESLKAIFCEPVHPSAQTKSAVLLAGLYAEGVTGIQETVPTRDHTERLLQYLGASLSTREGRLELQGVPFQGSPLQARSIDIPGDLSSAYFLIALTLVLPHSKLEISSVGLNPTRMGFLEALTSMGASLQCTKESEDSYEPIGSLEVSSSSLTSTKISGALSVRTIDELPLVALLATQAQGETRISDAKALRHKECDRIYAMTQELRRMGAQIEEHEDGWVISGPTRLQGTFVKSYGDHRVAMTLILAGMIAESETEIDSIDCISISFPNFLPTLLTLSK